MEDADDKRRSGGFEPELDRRHPELDLETDFEKLEENLESPNIIFFGEDQDPHLSSINCSRLILWWRWKQSRLKMWAGSGCGRLCIILLFIKLLVLSVLLPVVHLHEDHAQNPGNSRDSRDDLIVPDWGYPDPYGNTGHENGPYSENDAIPQESDHQNGDPTTLEGAGNGNGDHILVVRNEVDELTVAPTMAPSSENAKISSTSDALDGRKECPPPDSTPMESKLESIISTISNIHQSIEKMESLMQATLMDDQRGKTISAIHSGNASLALKHWTHILKYLNDNPSSVSAALTLLIKEAYNGVPEVIPNLTDFIQATSICTGWSDLYSEMLNYGHVFGSHPYIFTVVSKQRATDSCTSDAFHPHTLPAAVTSLLSGSFTLQNKGNSGYLYYAKRCVSRHYYHCLDVLTKKVSRDELDALEEGSEEWRKYRWRLNSTGEDKSYFFLLNEDKYLPYRLQDLNNSPRFKMEEASSQFEVDMAYFQLGLESDDEIVIQVRDTNMFLEGEEWKEGSNPGEILLHSFHKTEKALGESSQIKWIVAKEKGESNGNTERKLRIGRNSGTFSSPSHFYKLLK